MNSKLHDTVIAYDAVLIVSFGGPEGRNDVVPFLENVLRGRNVPRDRLLAVAHHYEMFGGVSPINEQNRKLIALLGQELQTSGPNLPIYWGNRNWHPMLADTVQQMANDGVKHALAFVTSAYSSFSSCRQYLQNIAEAQGVAGATAPQIDKLRVFYNHPLFIEANVHQIEAAFDQLAEGGRARAQLVFTAHSIPESMALNSDYEAQLKETSGLIAETLGIGNWSLAYQSRSGSPTQSWLGPDICDHLMDLAGAGHRDVVVAPIGFVSDHMEVIYDLDVEAQQRCREVGLNMIRAATAGTHPAFIKMIRQLMLERLIGALPRYTGSRGPSHDSCPLSCCLP